MFRLQFGGRRSDRGDLGVRRRVVGLRHQVDAFSQNRSIFHDEAGKRPAPGIDSPSRQCDRLLNEVHGRLPLRDTRFESSERVHNRTVIFLREGGGFPTPPSDAGSYQSLHQWNQAER